MAEKVKLFELDIDIKSLTDSAAEAYRSLTELKESQKDLRLESKELNAAMKMQTDAMKTAAKAGDSKAYDEAEKALSELKKQYKENSTAVVENATAVKTASRVYNMAGKMVQTYNETQQKSFSIAQATGGSIDQISAALSKNKAAYRALSEEERNNADVGGKLIAVITEQDKSYKDLSKSIGTNQVDVGNYKNAIKEAFEEGDYFNKGLQGLVGKIPLVGSSLAGVTGQLQTYIVTQRASAAATDGTGKSLKLFKIALISTGIGAIVVGLGMLVAAFLSSQEGIDAVSRALKPVTVIFKRLWGIVQQLGGSIVNAFKNPVEAINGLWQAIKTNIVNRFTGLIDTFKFLGKTLQAAFSLDFEGVKENAAKMGESVVQTITGVDELGKKISNTMKGANEFIKDSVRIGKELAALEIEISEAENALVISRAELTSEYEKQREIAQNVANSDTERKAAIQTAIKLQDELLAKEQGILDMKIKQKEITNSLNDTSREDEKELNELIAARTAFEGEAAKKRASARNLERGIDKKIEADRITNAKAAVDAAIKSSQLTLDTYIAESEGKAKSLDDQLVYEKEVYTKREALLSQQLNSGKISQAEYNLERLRIDKDYLQKQTELTISHAAKEVDLYVAKNKSKIDNETKLTDEIIEVEAARLTDVFDKKQEFLDQEYEAGLVSEQDYQLAKLELQGQFMEQEKQLYATYGSFKEGEKQKQLAKEQADWDAEMDLKIIRGDNAFQVMLMDLDREYAAKRAKAIEEGTWSVKQDELHAEQRKKITEAETHARMDQYEALFGGMAQLLGESTVAGKAAAIAMAGINTWEAVTVALAAKSLIPDPFRLPAKIVEIGTIIGTGLKSVQKITGIGVPKAEHGAVMDIGGKRHSAGGTKFYGDDGTTFEAEKGEKMFILNRMASKHYAPYLSTINQMYGGVPLTQSVRYLATGGVVQRAQNVKMEGIDYDLLAIKVAERVGDRFDNSIRRLPVPVTDVKDIIREVKSYNKIVDGASF